MSTVEHEGRFRSSETASQTETLTFSSSLLHDVLLSIFIKQLVSDTIFFLFSELKKNEVVMFLVSSKVVHAFLFIVTGQNTITVAVVHSLTEYM